MINWRYLYSVVSQVGRLSGGSVSCDLWHRRKVASLSVFFKIDSLVDHPVRGLFPAQCSFSSAVFFFQRSVLFPAQCSFSSAVFFFQRSVLFPAQCSFSSAVFFFQRSVLFPAQCSFSSAVFFFQRSVLFPAQCSFSSAVFFFQRSVLFPAQYSFSSAVFFFQRSILFPAQYSFSSAVFFFQRSILHGKPTRGALAAHSRFFEMHRSRTVQFSRSFVPSCVRLWNGLHESVFAGEGLGAFKTSVNRFRLQGWLPAVSSFSSTISLSFFLFSGPKIAWGSLDL